MALLVFQPGSGLKSNTLFLTTKQYSFYYNSILIPTNESLFYSQVLIASGNGKRNNMEKQIPHKHGIKVYDMELIPVKWVLGQGEILDQMAS